MSQPHMITGPHDQTHLSGHVSACDQICTAIKNNHVHHAWLLSGMQGIGKATLGYFFARYLLAIPTEVAGGLFGETLPQAPLPEHLTDLETQTDLFQLVANGSHPDFRLIKRSVDEKTGRMKTEISVSQIRALSAFLHKTPSLAAWRVVLIDSAEEMNRSAANALLKILEEPPKNALVILISHAPGRLLPTLRSRCRHLRLSALEDEHVSEIWHPISEIRNLSQQDYLSAKQIFPGSIGQILSFCEFGGGELITQIQTHFDSAQRPSRADFIKFAEDLATKEEAQFILFQAILQHWLSTHIKQRALQMAGHAKLNVWTQLWQETIHKLKRLQQAHLDRKMVLFEIFCAIDDVLYK